MSRKTESCLWLVIGIAIITIGLNRAQAKPAVPPATQEGAQMATEWFVRDRQFLYETVDTDTNILVVILTLENKSGGRALVRAMESDKRWSEYKIKLQGDTLSLPVGTLPW